MTFGSSYKFLPHRYELFSTFWSFLLNPLLINNLAPSVLLPPGFLHPAPVVTSLQLL